MVGGVVVVCAVVEGQSTISTSPIAAADETGFALRLDGVRDIDAIDNEPISALDTGGDNVFARLSTAFAANFSARVIALTLADFLGRRTGEGIWLTVTAFVECLEKNLCVVALDLFSLFIVRTSMVGSGGIRG
jgi:hypothetical protein